MFWGREGGEERRGREGRRERKREKERRTRERRRSSVRGSWQLGALLFYLSFVLFHLLIYSSTHYLSIYSSGGVFLLALVLTLPFLLFFIPFWCLPSVCLSLFLLSSAVICSTFLFFLSTHLLLSSTHMLLFWGDISF